MVSSRRKREIAEIADQTRRLAGISTYGINDIFDACQSLNYYYLRYPLMDGVLGAVIKRDAEYIIFSNSSVVYSREIFTLAHEIGHIRLGHLNSETQTMEDTNHTISSNDEKEVEANFFAACFLIPKDALLKIIEVFDIVNFSILDIVRLQSVFNTSFETTINRLNYLSIINEQKLELLKLQKKEQTISSILKSIGNDANLCIPSNVKAISMDYLKWIQFNYSNNLISKATAEKALGYLDISIDSIDIEPVNYDDDFDFDAFWEDDDE